MLPTQFNRALQVLSCFYIQIFNIFPHIMIAHRLVRLRARQLNQSRKAPSLRVVARFDL